MCDKVISVTCRLCNQSHEIHCNQQDYTSWKDGEGFIQDLMPYLTDDDRELLISKTCGTCFDNAVHSAQFETVEDILDDHLTDDDLSDDDLSDDDLSDDMDDDMDDDDMDDDDMDDDDDLSYEEEDEEEDEEEEEEIDDCLLDLSIREQKILAEWCEAVSKFLVGDRTDDDFCKLGMNIFVATDDGSSVSFKALADKLRQTGNHS